MKKTNLLFAFLLLATLLGCQESFDETPVTLESPNSGTVRGSRAPAHIDNQQQEYKPGRTLTTWTKYSPVYPREWGLHEYRLVLYKSGVRIRELTEATVEDAIYWKGSWTIPADTPYGHNYQLGYVYVDFNRGGAKYYSALTPPFSIVDQEGCWMKVTDLNDQYTEGQVISGRVLTISRGVTRTVTIEFAEHYRIVKRIVRDLHSSPYNAQAGETYFTNFDAVVTSDFTPGFYTMSVKMECGGGFVTTHTQRFQVLESTIQGAPRLVDAIQ